MKVSIITTVYNEEKNISKLIDSIIIQTRKPDELIIVDGGSKDKTFQILEEYSKLYKWIKVIQKKGANIAEGRNIAIKESSGDIIFTSDSGTIFEKDWVEKILNGFKENADVVFGAYYSKPHTMIEKFLISRLPNWGKVNPSSFIPSNRNVAFRRKVWEEIGGFPENINRADDNWFHSRAHEKGFKYVFIKDAKVQWLYDRNLKQMTRLAFLDSKTEGFSLMFLKRKIYFVEIFSLLILIVSLILGLITNYKILTFLLIIILLVLLIYFFMIYRKTRDILVAFVAIPLSAVLFFAHVFGLITGLIQRIYKKKE